MEDWAEIRRLHAAEGLPIKEIARRLNISRNTVRAALWSDAPPKYERTPAGSLVNPFELGIGILLAEYPRMPASVIAERLGWEHSASIFRTRVSKLRPEYAGIDPVDKTTYRPGEIAQCDLWFPETRIPVAAGQDRILPVPIMVTSNLPFGRWGETFGDDVVAAAMIDPLVHHAEVLTLSGDSYRTHGRRELLGQISRDDKN